MVKLEDMAQKHDIVLMQVAPIPAVDIMEYLHGQGFGTRLVSEIAQAVEVLPKLKAPILILDCGRMQEDAHKYVKAVLKEKKLHPFPIIVIGKDVDSYEDTLEKYFSLCLTIVTPAQNEQVFKATLYVAENYPGIEAEPSEEIVKEIPETPEEIVKDVPEEEEKEETVANMLFVQYDSLRLDRTTLSSRDYLVKTNLDEIKSSGILPKNQRVNEEIQTLYSDSKKWIREHLCRTAYVNARFTEVLEMLDSSLEDSRAAAFLYAWSFGVPAPELLQGNYLSSETSIRNNLSIKLKESAHKIEAELNEKKMAEIVRNMAAIIGSGKTPSNEQDAILASSLVAADLVDRLCFQSGSWSPRAVHYLMRRAKRGELNTLHPAILCCLVKFAFESASILPPAFVLKTEIKEDPELTKIHEETKSYIPSNREMKVPIMSLKPGMRLAKALVAYDGRVVLPQGIVLDEDLIWRIWQIAAIRVLNTPIVVTAE